MTDGGGFALGTDAFCFDTPAPGRAVVSSREALRRALYAGGIFAATGRLALDGYALLDGTTSARLDAMTEGVLAWLKREEQDA